MNKYIESITQLTVAVSGLQVRVWRQEEMYTGSVANKTYQELNDALIQSNLAYIAFNCKEVADVLFQIDRVNAVEVKNAEGLGVVLYKDWP